MTEAHEETAVEHAAHSSPEATPASPHIRVVDDIRGHLKSRVNEVLQALASSEGASGADALVDNVYAEMERMGMLPGNHTGRILQAVADAIAENSRMPEDIRKLFHGRPAPASFREVQERLQQGSAAFNRRVFNRLRADKSAREALHLTPTSRAFSNHEAYETFLRVTGEFVPSVDSVAYMGAAFSSVSHIPPSSPGLTVQRQDLLKQVVRRMAPHERSFMSKIPASRRGKILEVLVQAGAVGAIALGAPVAGAVALAGVPLAETLTGISKTDLIEGRNLWRRFAENNLVSRMLTNQQSAGKTLKSRLAEWFKRSIPGSGFWFGGRHIGEAASEGAAEMMPEGGHAETAETANVEELIRQACRQEMGRTGGGGASVGRGHAAGPAATPVAPAAHH